MSERGEYLLPIQNVVAQLRKVGIDVKLHIVDHTTYHHNMRADMNSIDLYNCWRPTADVFLTHFYLSNSSVVTGESPITNFSHIGKVDANGDGTIDGVDDLIKAARRELDAAKQAELWKEAQLKAQDWAVSYATHIKKFTFARRNYVDWGYELISTLILSPQINELTTISK